MLQTRPWEQVGYSYVLIKKSVSDAKIHTFRNTHLGRKCPNIYLLIIHNNYFNYAIIAWGSVSRTNLKKVNSKQKHVTHLFPIKTNMPTRGKFFKSKELQTYIWWISEAILPIFMQELDNTRTHSIFLTKFCKTLHALTTTRDWFLSGADFAYFTLTFKGIELNLKVFFTFFSDIYN